jgi:hypothetical protein
MSMKQRLVAMLMLLTGSSLAAGLVVGAFHADAEGAHETVDRSAPASTVER